MSHFLAVPIDGFQCWCLDVPSDCFSIGWRLDSTWEEFGGVSVKGQSVAFRTLSGRLKFPSDGISSINKSLCGSDPNPNPSTAPTPYPT